MCDAYLHIRHKPVENVMDGLKFLHPVVKEEYLSSPVQLVSDDLLYLVMIEKHYLGLHRNPVRRRRADDGKVTCTQKRELEGTWYRSGCKGQCIHRSLELTELFLGAYSELLLLIDYEKSKILEFEALSYKFMCSYHYIQGTGFQPFLDIGYFLCSAESADIIYIAWKILKTVPECIEMLKGKNGRRNKHSDLLAVGNCLECGTYGHLGLSEAHISADKPVHRTIILHVPLDSLHSLLLIRSILVHE